MSLFSFFFFKQKTAYEIKECDWSSDVCSSDLPEWQEENLRTIQIPFKPPIGEVRAFPVLGDSMEPKVSEGAYIVAVKLQDPRNETIQIGRASCRERV